MMVAITNNDRLALLLACLGALLVVLYPIFDYDLYWHLANGREMAQGGRIITEEVFSYTHPGESFENHEWLAQILFYLIWQGLGPYGLLGLKLLVTILIVILGYNTARAVGGQPWTAALLCVFAVLAGFYRYIERPELFSLLYVALLSFILYHHRAGRLPPKILWLIPLILLTWNWLHGAVYGLALLSLFVAGENLKHLFPALRREFSAGPRDLRTLNQCYALTMLLMLIDPFGLRSYGIFFGILGGAGAAVSNVQEYLPITWREFKPFIFLLTWTAILAMRHIRRIDITQLLLLVVFGTIAVRYSRATGVAAIVLIPILASLLALCARQASGKLQHIQVTAMLLVASLFVGVYGYIVKFAEKSPQAFGYQLDDSLLPAGCVRFIQATGLSGNYYNTGHFGGYLSYYLAPERKIFQYNLPTVFGDSYRFTEHPEELTRWNLNYAIVGNADELTRLFPAYAWARVYRDSGAVLVVRRTPQNQALIQQYELRFFHPMMQDDDLRRRFDNPRILPRLTEEMGIYLAYRKDERIASLWAEILGARPDLRNHPRIQQLLGMALEFNKGETLAGMKQ